MVKQGFCEGIASRRRYVDWLGPVQLDGFTACVGELLIESDPREDFLEVLSRVGSTRLDSKLKRRIQQRGSSTTDLLYFGCFDHLDDYDASHQLASATTVKAGTLSLIQVASEPRNQRHPVDE